MLCENIDIVYHGAATVRYKLYLHKLCSPSITRWTARLSCRFDEVLKKAVLLNARGTKQMIELAKEMKHLLLFVHISTAYCHLEEKVSTSHMQTGKIQRKDEQQAVLAGFRWDDLSSARESSPGNQMRRMDGRWCSRGYDRQNLGQSTKHICFYEGLRGNPCRGIHATYSIDNSKVILSNSSVFLDMHKFYILLFFIICRLLDQA